MKTYATLLIQHIEAIYTMSPSTDMIIHHGFLAIHHDRILAVGEGEGWSYVDKDTRLLEGRGHIAIPGLIDVGFAWNQGAWQFPDVDQVRRFHEISTIMMKHGTLIVHSDQPLPKQLAEAASSNALLDVHSSNQRLPYPVITPLDAHSIQTAGKRGCISCGYPEYDCLDQLLCMKLFAYAHPEQSELQLLSTCTTQPARVLSLSHVGQLRKGWHANILLLEGQTFQECLNRFHGDEAIQVIKDGVRRLPSVIV